MLTTKRFKTVLSTVFLIAGTLLCAGATKTSQPLPTPDFAFPKTVEEDSFGRLQAALRAHKPVDALRAFMDWSVASTLISAENATKVLQTADSIGNNLEAPYSAVLYLLEAQIYSDIYHANQWTFDGRTVDADMATQNPEFWDRQIFASKIQNLLSEALAEKSSAENLPLENVAILLDDAAPLSSFSLYDLIVYKAIELNQTFSSKSVIPFYPQEASTIDSCQLLESLLTLHPRPSLARSTALLYLALLKTPLEMKEFLRTEIEGSADSEFVVPLLSFYFNMFLYSSSLNESVKFELYKDLHWFLDVVDSVANIQMDSEYRKALSDMKCCIFAEEGNIRFPSTASTFQPVQVNVISRNISDFYVVLLSVPQSKPGRVTLAQLKSQFKTVASRHIVISDDTPFVSHDSVCFDISKPGTYTFILSRTPDVSGLIHNGYSYFYPTRMEVSDIDILSVNRILSDADGGKSKPDISGCFVMNTGDGSPVKGASVKFENQRSYYEKGKTKSEHRSTDSAGFASTTLENAEATASFNGSRATTYINCYRESQLSEELQCRLFADRAVFRPGDRVNFLAILFEADGNNASVASGTEVKVFLRNANREKLDSITGVSDSSGRFSGSFTIPADGLLGQWSLYSEYGSCFLQVAEYKTPSFFVSLQKSEAAPDSIAFKGIVSTFAGMPLGDTKVDFSVEYSPRFARFYNSNRQETFSSSVFTAPDGEFRIVLPISNLDAKHYDGVFKISASATDSAGETQTSNTEIFFLRNSFFIDTSIPGVVKLTSDSLSFPVKVMDIGSLPVIRELEYSVFREGESSPVLQGEFQSPLFSLDASTLPSGRYRFEFNVKDGGIEPYICNTILYRPTDTIPPVETALWVPSDKVTATESDSEVAVPFGSSFPGQHILCYISDSEGHSSYRWITSDGTIQSLMVPVPAADARRFVQFFAFRDHRLYEESVTVIPFSQSQKLEIETVTFRNHLEPGATESWRFKVNLGSDPHPAFAYALLYDKALDAIAPLNWNTSLFYPSYPKCVNIWGNSCGIQFDSFQTNGCNPPYLSVPDLNFQTYGYPLATQRSSTRGPVMYKMASRSMATADDAADVSVVEEEVAFDYGRSIVNATAKLESASYMESPAAQIEGVTQAEAGQTGSLADVKLRPIELPVAFFKPDLSTDADGLLDIEFTVPDFNTTWRLLLGAYDSSLSSAGRSLESVAAKKVMVRMLAPRFLRTGDDIRLTATLFNNSDQTLPIEGVYEIFNPLSGEVLQRLSTPAYELTPSANRVFSTDFHCPDFLNAVGLRVYALSQGASDGEETVIPILPSSQPVVESFPFYLSAGQQDLSLELPAVSLDSKATFKYCDNPSWEALTALPSIIEPASSSLTSLLDAFYASCVGDALVAPGSDLYRGLQLIVDGEAGDSLLVSNLSKDQNLKVVTLNNTPWVNDAASENLRLSRLALLLDKRRCHESILDLWKKIAALQNPDGGWSWCKGMKSSPYITQSLLLYAARLKSQGALPSLPGLDDAVRKALRFVESHYLEVYNDTKGSKDAFYSSLLDFLYVSSSLPAYKPSSAFSAVRHAALAHLASSWKSLSIFNKATAAVTLYRGGYPSMAREILESLRQYASSSPVKGVWFDNLDSSLGGMDKLSITARALTAFYEISPSDSIVDGLRQWLLLQKQATDWQEGTGCVDAIYAVLTSGSPWTGNYASPEIRIGDTVIAPSEFEQLTGSLTISIDPANLSGSDLSIRRSSPSPAWGGLISQYISPMESVTAHAVEGLSVSKELWKIVESPEGTVAVRCDTLSVGDKVRVTLIIDNARDMDFVTLTDARPACLEPADQLSGYRSIDGIWTYLETRNSSTSLFFDFLPRGRNVISYECRVSEAGTFASGIATLQCLYSPLLTAHTAGTVVVVNE